MQLDSCHPHEEEARQILKTLKHAGFTAYFAGGCVRDRIMGRTPKDYDIATHASPEQIEGLFERTLPTGKAFGVISVLRENGSYEVATFRRDLPYGDGRRPLGVEFGGAEEDALRRDFTINGLFYDPETDQVLDFVGGLEDLDNKVIRAIGDPRQRMQEDHLRMLRAVRFASTLGFEIDSTTRSAIRALAHLITGVSQERIEQELTRLLCGAPLAGQGVEMLHDLGLLVHVLPEVAAMAGVQQPPEYHPEGDVLTHTLLMLDATSIPTRELAYAVLLHDVGKPPTASRGPSSDGGIRIRFDRHAQEGARIAEGILRRLRLPSAVIHAVTHCVRNHMRFMDAQHMRESTLRKLVAAPTFPVELELHRLDCICSHGDLGNYDFLGQFVRELQNEPPLPDRWITGHDILALGVPEGPGVGHWLNVAYDAQMEGTCDDRDQLMTWLRKRLPKVDAEP